MLIKKRIRQKINRWKSRKTEFEKLVEEERKIPWKKRDKKEKLDIVSGGLMLLGEIAIIGLIIYYVVRLIIKLM